MRVSRGRTGRLARSLRGFGARFSLVIAALLSLALLIFSQLNPPFLEQTRAAVDDALSPALEVANIPVRVVEDLVSWSEEVAFLYRENRRLREENERLIAWHLTAQRLATENHRLKALLNAHDSAAVTIATARVVGQSAGNYVRTILINVGEKGGVVRGNIAADASGVLGRVISSGEETARVLLLTDLNSRVPVKILPADVNAILIGDNLDQPMLTFYPTDTKINVGNWVVTTGHGGIFPADLPIGRVAFIPPGGKPRVALSADLSRLDYVRLFSSSSATATRNTPSATP